MKRTNLWKLLAGTIVLCAAGALDAATLAYWRFEDGTNGQPIASVADFSGNGYTLTEAEAGSVTTVTNPGFPDPVRRTGASNKLSAYFDAGVTNGWLRNTSFTGINGLNNFTVEFFIQTPVMLPNAAILTVNLLLITEDYQYDGNLWIHVSNCGNYLGNYLKISPYNAPHHIAVERVGTGPGYSEGVYNLYVDGVLDPSSGRQGEAISTTPWEFLEVGHLTGNGAVGATLYPFTGTIDEIRISDVALRPDQFLNAPPHGAVVSFR